MARELGRGKIPERVYIRRRTYMAASTMRTRKPRRPSVSGAAGESYGRALAEALIAQETRRAQ